MPEWSNPVPSIEGLTPTGKPAGIDLTRKPLLPHNHDGVNTPKIRYKDLDIQPGDVQIIRPFVAGEALNKGQAVYLSSDGKVYATDATDSSKVNFVGFVVTSTPSGESAPIRTQGVQGGFSGLSAGTNYFLANNDSLDTISYTTDTTSVETFSGTAGESHAYSMTFTLTHTSKIQSFDMKISKDGNPNDLMLAVCAGDEPGSFSPLFGDENYGGCAVLALESYDEGDFSTTPTVETLDLTTDLILNPGTYSVIVWTDESGGVPVASGQDHSFQGTTQSVGRIKDRFDSTGDTWTTSGAIDLYFVVNMEAVSVSAGDVHPYFFDVPKFVGQAISSTEIFIARDSTQFAQGRITVSAETPTTVTLGFAPRLVIVNALVRKDAASDVVFCSFGAVDSSSQGCVSFSQTATSTYTSQAITDFVAAAYESSTSNEVDEGGAGSIILQSTGFIFGPTDKGTENLVLQWIAYS